jgi:hypothetical protein
VKSQKNKPKDAELSAPMVLVTVDPMSNKCSMAIAVECHLKNPNDEIRNFWIVNDFTDDEVGVELTLKTISEAFQNMNKKKEPTND